MSNEVKELKDLAAKTIEAIHPLLVDTAKTIHGFAEIKYEEIKSSNLLADRLADMGFEVERGAGGLETAFAARYGKESPCMAFIAEYDALPNIGHGCGHNLIGPGAIGAAAAIKSLVDQGRVSGSVAVMGTPAEEGGGGKIPMVEQGVFEGVDASVLIHPGQGNIFDVGSRAKRSFNLEFFGQSSHASADPEKGINALEAMIQTFVGINAIRQHVEDSVRIHGIITHGGDAPNVVPGYTSGQFIVRADTMPQVNQVFEKVMGCIKGAALASGCTHKLVEDSPYKEKKPNSVLNELFVKNANSLGREMFPRPDMVPRGSTDLGNLSHAVPTIGTFLEICGLEIPNHSKELAEAATKEPAWKMIEDAARIMAYMAIDVMSDPQVMDRIKQSFHEA